MREADGRVFYQTKSRAECTNSGLAVLLLSLVIGYGYTHNSFFIIPITLLLLVVVVPSIYKPVSWTLRTISLILGAVSTTVVLTGIFIFMVIPIGYVRKWLGYDPLQWRKWKKSKESVFRSLNHTYTREDLLHPY